MACVSRSERGREGRMEGWRKRGEIRKEGNQNNT